VHLAILMMPSAVAAVFGGVVEKWVDINGDA
jgi:hypothetical protein